MTRGIEEESTHNGYVQVCATAPEIAPAPNLPTTDGFFSPAGVKYVLTDSYTMKFKPTWHMSAGFRAEGREY